MTTQTTTFIEKLLCPMSNALRVRDFVQEFKRGMKTETPVHVIEGTFVDGVAVVTIDNERVFNVSVTMNTNRKKRVIDAILFGGHLLGEGINLHLDADQVANLHKYKRLSTSSGWSHIEKRPREIVIHL